MNRGLTFSRIQQSDEASRQGNPLYLGGSVPRGIRSGMLSIQAWTRASAFLSVALITVLLGHVPARAEPPIRSPEDAACRVEARAKVFSAPNPKGLELEDIGRQIYFACMARTTQATAQPPTRKHRRHRRR